MGEGGERARERGVQAQRVVAGEGGACRLPEVGGASDVQYKLTVHLRPSVFHDAPSFTRPELDFATHEITA